MVNIKQVAQTAGCSTATVSYVLNRTRRVSPEMADRVMTAVNKLGYSISYAAQNLASKHSNILGLIVSNITNPFFSETARSFQDHALLHNMDAIVMHTNYDVHRTLAALQRLLGLRVPGIAVLTTEVYTPVTEILLDNEVFSVYLDQEHAGPLSSNIALDFNTGIKEAIDYLIQLGHRHIAFIGGLPPSPSILRRRQAFAEYTSAQSGLSTTIVEAECTMSGAYFAAAKLLTGPNPKPTAIMTVNDIMAIGAMHYAYDQGLKVPDRLSIIGFDNISFSEYTQPALTTINLPAEKIGQIAFETLWRMMKGEDAKKLNSSQSTQLVIRQSCASVPHDLSD